jgi:predicted membrane protein (TIGR00267 family)
LLPLVLGITDGILNALTLSAGAIVRGGGDITVLLALRVGTAALVTAAFTMFVADYAERRSSLVRASRQLNMTEPGRLAATHLGRQAVKESAIAMAVAAGASLLGAALPLLVGAVLPGPSWIVLVLTIGSLGVLGWILGGLMAAHRARWAIAMLIGGVIVTAIGVLLNIT